MAIAKKLLQIQESVKGMTKDKAAFNYNYVSGDKILNHIRPWMDKLQLLLLPSVKDIRTETVTYTAWDKAAKALINKTEILHIVDMTMTWIDAEDGERLDIPWAGAGLNAFDKGYGSALTYGERYYLLKTFHIATDADDVDAVSARRDEDLQAGYAAQAAGNRPETAIIAPNPAVNAPNDKVLAKYVEAHATGKKTKDGGNIRDYYIAHFAPDAAALAHFDELVSEYKINHNL